MKMKKNVAMKIKESAERSSVRILRILRREEG